VGEQIPPDVRDFILRYIDSVAEMEALLLLRSTPAQVWSAEAAAARLYIAPDEALQILKRLADEGLLAQSEEGFRFACRTPELEQKVDAAAGFYSANLIPVTNLIHSKPRRIRQFADAFKLKDR